MIITRRSAMNLAELNKVAEAMVARGRGFWPPTNQPAPSRSASTPSASSSTTDNRRDYREMLFRTTEAMSKYISGVILYDETIRQNAKDGTPLVKLIEKAGSHSRHQGRQGHQAAAVLSRRSDHRRPRRPARAARRISRARREVRQMARGDRYRQALAARSRATPAFAPMPMRSHAMPRSARTKVSCRSSSPKC